MPLGALVPPIVSSPEKAKNFNIEILLFCEDNGNNVPVLDIYVVINVCVCFILWSHVLLNKQLTVVMSYSLI